MVSFEIVRESGSQESYRVDERDTMFARSIRQPGTPAYLDYYGRRPELQGVDDRIRDNPQLLMPGGRYYDPEVMSRAKRWFDSIEHLEPDREQAGKWAPRFVGKNATREVVAMARELGAVAAGCTQIDEAFVYTHKGRFDSDYSYPIRGVLPWVIVFLVEMDHHTMRQAPLGPVIVESARQYHEAAKIGFTIAEAFRLGGHQAKAHYDAHYDVILPPITVAAGLGELGRNNILVADRYGSRVRIGAVTTDLVLSPSKPRSLGVRAFCERCMKCAENCPTGALSKGEPVEVRGVLKWPTKIEKCYAHWRRIGTDCGICMAVCPFSHRNNWFHNLVRSIVRIRPTIAPLALRGDNLLYGRKWKPLV